MAVCALLLPAGNAFGHAAFVGAEPAPGVRLDQAPQRVVLTFTGPLNRRLSRATLVRVDGASVAIEVQAASERRLILRPAGPLDPGAYRVRWHTVSTEDGHALEGSFSFGVRAPAVGAERYLEQSPLARSGWVRVSLRAFLYVAVLLFAAGLVLPLLVRASPSWLAPAALDREVREAPAVRLREQRVVGDLAWLSVAAAVAATLAEAVDAAGGLSLAGVRDFLFSGSSGGARVATVLALVVAAGAVARRPRWAVVSAALALWGIALSGHAGSATPRIPSVANDWLHLASGAVWLGGIGLLGLVWAPALRRGGPSVRQAVARHVLPAFGRVALPAFVLVVITGVVSLVMQLGYVDALWTTAYGRVLLVKIALVGVIAAPSAAHAWRFRPRVLAGRDGGGGAERRYWRLVRSEPLVGLGVVAAVAVLVAFPLPPRQLGDAEEAAAAAPDCDPCPLPKPAADELSVAGQAGSLVVAGWLRSDGERITGTIRALDIRNRPVDAPVDVLGASQRGCGQGCTRFSMRAAATVRVAAQDRGRRFVAALPALWRLAGAKRARRLLERAQRTMRALRSVREVEEITSGPGSYARTEYRLQAPNRMAFTTAARTRGVSIGSARWYRTEDAPWTRSAGVPFSMSRWFRWTSYATSAHVLGRRGREVEIALMDAATPVWLRLAIDERTGRVVRERMVTGGHFMHSRYYAFNRAPSIEAPDHD